MENDREQRIREHAYRLWEQEGRPEGADLDHWQAALSQFDKDGTDGEVIAENTSVLGEPEPDAPPTKSKREGKGGKKGSTFTTGEESASKAVRHAEGP